ncbi:polysaccharide deacetylase family protein [Alsobacter sp. KACC 23698]|uniref:Chitooligosaccharide deacetylase n=1 Tax=Alsobacter sp. KACC 23698 TaxID=3149229 RepID=A0AAU7JN29_9HYPH
MLNMGLKHRLYGAAFAGLAAAGAPRWAGSGLRGLGGILMLHHVRPWVEREFAPNRLLEVTPEFLDLALTRARAAGYRFVPLDEAVDAVEAGRVDQRVLALTFDDGYRDNLEHALPVLRAHGAPATIFVTPGFVERSAELWWLDLEDAIARAAQVSASIGGETLDLPASTAAQKSAAFETIYWRLRARPEPELRAVIAGLAREQGVDSRATAERLCLDWDGVRRLAADPLIAIGAHTLTHPMLAKHDAETARREMAESKAILEKELGAPVRHLAYPVGDRSSAGPRDFALARELGFRSAVTTRRGMLFPEHARHLTALPRISLNGFFQDPGQFEVLLSGVPFWLWNRGRRVDAA